MHGASPLEKAAATSPGRKGSRFSPTRLMLVLKEVEKKSSTSTIVLWQPVPLDLIFPLSECHPPILSNLAPA
jgi:hypothetical protein